MIFRVEMSWRKPGLENWTPISVDVSEQRADEIIAAHDKSDKEQQTTSFFMYRKVQVTT